MNKVQGSGWVLPQWLEIEKPATGGWGHEYINYLMCYNKWNHIIITPLFFGSLWSLKRWHRASTGEIYVPDNTKVLSVKFYPIEKVKKARYGLLTFSKIYFLLNGYSVPLGIKMIKQKQILEVMWGNIIDISNIWLWPHIKSSHSAPGKSNIRKICGSDAKLQKFRFPQSHRIHISKEHLN